MTPDRDQQIMDVFLAAAELPEDRRPAYLDEACSGDDELRSEVEMLETIERNGYNEQVKRYVDAVMIQLGQRPRALLIFLQIGGSRIGLADIE